jgi:RNA polymerase sigma-70 factor (ECF subfamily)
MASRDTPEEESAPSYARLPAAERQELFTALVLCRTALDTNQQNLLREMFAAIFYMYFDRLWRYIRRQVANDADAEDRLQDTYISIYVHLLDHGFPDSLLNMLYKHARGHVWNHARRNGRTPESVPLPSSGSEKPISEREIEYVLDLRELERVVTEALNEEQRALVDTVILDEMSHSEAATVLDLPLGTVKSRVLAVKAALLAIAKRAL